VVDERGEALTLYTLSGAPREAFEKFGHPRATPIFGPTFRGEAIIRLDDVRKDPRYGRMAPYHGMPPGHLPVRSYLAVPVISRSKEVLGGLIFGHPEPGVFTERSERLVSGVAAQAAVAIDNARLYEAAQKAAAEREQLLESERHARTIAETASREKDDFLATLSHELRTPLTAILGWAHLLNRDNASEQDFRKGLEVIERNARAQTRLIEDLLDMSRITSGKMRLNVQPVLPSTFIEAAVETVRPAAEAKGVRLECVLDPRAGPMNGDPDRLQQVMWNLLSNAIKFTPRGGKVQVVAQRVESHIEATVSDSGAGIAPEVLPHLFERFRQADASTTRQFGGLGLGLAIVKNLVEMHGGTVVATSDGLGRGATFRVCLPLAAVGWAAPAHSPHQAKPTNRTAPTSSDVDLTGLKILVVDDQPDARELVSRVLRDHNAEVTSAGSAEEGLTLLQRSRPDVLISDIGMPSVDGYEFLRRVRALGRGTGGSIPAIALTAFARSEDRTRALREGFQVHVAKPVEPEELVVSVASLVRRQRDLG
jgi:signal transduction histidine kinase/ActR/RegA family two-component response regulator